jgi:hypothetical protein
LGFARLFDIVKEGVEGFGIAEDLALSAMRTPSGGGFKATGTGSLA